jgi:hypothetical protein
VHTQNGDTVTLVDEIRAHDQSQQGLTWTFEHGPVLPDLSATHPGKGARSPSAPVEGLGLSLG